MTLLAVGLCLAAGFFGLTYWFCLPLGFLLYLGIYRFDRSQAKAVSGSVCITSPLIALALMAFGRLFGG